MVNDNTIHPNLYMKEPGDLPYKPCDQCGAEINANWTIRACHAKIKEIEQDLRDLHDSLLEENL